MERLKVAILPAGQWGTAFSIIASENGHQPTLYFRLNDDCNRFRDTHQNSKRLPGVILPANVRGTSTLRDALCDADIVVLAPPVRSFRELYRKARVLIRPASKILSLTKGLEPDTHYRMTQVLEQENPGISSHVAVWSGPNLAGEIAEGKTAGADVASTNPAVASFIQEAFGRGRLRLHTTNDVIGVEFGGSLKNIIAIAIGIYDGLKMGDNNRGLLIRRGLNEMVRFGVAFGASERTFYGSSGMDDLITTCTSPKSRNYKVGVDIGRGVNPVDLLTSDKTREGLHTAIAAVDMAEQKKVKIPIMEMVYKIVYQGLQPRQGFAQLMKLELNSENGD